MHLPLVFGAPLVHVDLLLGGRQRSELGTRESTGMARIRWWGSLVQLTLPAVVVVVDPILLVSGQRFRWIVCALHVTRQGDLLNCLDRVKLTICRGIGVVGPRLAYLQGEARTARNQLSTAEVNEHGSYRNCMEGVRPSNKMWGWTFRYLKSVMMNWARHGQKNTFMVGA